MPRRMLATVLLSAADCSSRSHATGWLPVRRLTVLAAKRAKHGLPSPAGGQQRYAVSHLPRGVRASITDRTRPK